jgi:Cu/Ag efflux pump CusA
MESTHPDASAALQTRIRQLRWFLTFWLLVFAIYATLFTVTLVARDYFDPLFLGVALAMAGGAVLDIIWIRSAKRQLRMLQS